MIGEPPVFNAARLKRGHPIIPNYQYSKGDGNVTNSIEPTDDVLTVAAIVWVSLRPSAAH
jgi:hypothetical protein